MSATDILIMFAELLGGLAFFLYGMSAMSSGLEQMAGGSLERTLRKVTSSDFLSFFLGAGITIAIQSSSAMTVMLVGLVNSGIITFGDTFGMIMGSHVGTTLTGWILTLGGISGDNFLLVLLKPTTFAPLLAFIGIVLRMLSKKEKRRTLGMILIGFAVLMAGMDFMSNSMNTFRQDPAFQSLLTAFTSPIVAFAVSTLFTGIIQSSAATVAIVQALALASFASDNPLTYQVAIPLVIGANVGTCVTALISAIGTNTEAKRVVAMHLYTNAIGGVICVGLMYVVMAIDPNLMLAPVSIIGVAMIHSLFNILNTVAFIPFKGPLLALCRKSVRQKEERGHTVFLDERLFNNIPLAVSECQRLNYEMAEHARTAYQKAIGLLQNYDEAIGDEIQDLETLTDKYEDRLGDYLVRISNHSLSDSESHAVNKMLHSIGDFERITDHALNLRDTALEIRDKKIIFSDSAGEELKTITGALNECVNYAIDSFIQNDPALASHVEPLEQVIDHLNATLKARHVERLQRGECTVQLGFVFSDILMNYERISDHCSNIGAYTLAQQLDTHRYLMGVKSAETGEFVDYFNEYSGKYNVDSIE